MRSLLLSSLAALQALVVGLPQPQPLSIPLTKRSTLRNADGYVDSASIRAHISSTEAYVTVIVQCCSPLIGSSKLHRGTAAFERNTGVALSPSLTKRAGVLGSDPLIDNENSTWYGIIKVGTPPKTFSGFYPSISSR
jgi:cathepsin D